MTIPNARREALLAEARSIADKSAVISKSDAKRIDVILAQVAEARNSDETPEQRQHSKLEHQHDQEFRSYLRGGPEPMVTKELRTAFDTSAGSGIIPILWEGGFQSKLVSFSGLRAAGSNVIQTKSGANMLYPYSDDSANAGIRQAEGTAVNLDIVPSITLNTLGTFVYNSQAVTISKELVEDLGFDLDGYLQTIFARRIGQITNKEFTLGAGGGPTGVIPSLTSALTTASPAAVTTAELLSLISAVDPAYRDGAVFMFSPGVEAILKGTLSTLSGERLYPEMSDSELLGFSFVVNVDMPASLLATGKAITFGNFKAGVTIREAAPILVKSTERNAEFYQNLYVLISRQGVILTDPAAVKVITQHA